MSSQTPLFLKKIYRRLFKAFGPQDWWPGDSPFEVIVGAILTQNTNWGNVEKAISNLKKAYCLSINSLHKISHARLAQLIKPSGFFNLKAKRLKNFVSFLVLEYKGKLSLMKKQDVFLLRSQLLRINGIGQETADSILLYALDKPIFVVDAYTKRIFSRHNIVGREDTYQEVQDVFMLGLKKECHLYNEYHALIVKLAKEFCKVKPHCEGCPLAPLL